MSKWFDDAETRAQKRHEEIMQGARVIHAGIEDLGRIIVFQRDHIEALTNRIEVLTKALTDMRRELDAASCIN